MLDHFSAKYSILVLSLPIKNMLDYFAFDVFFGGDGRPYTRNYCLLAHNH